MSRGENRAPERTGGSTSWLFQYVVPSTMTGWFFSSPATDTAGTGFNGANFQYGGTAELVRQLNWKDSKHQVQTEDDARALSLRATRSGRGLYERINGELIAQQAALLRDLDPDMRAAATQIIQRLAQAAEARFVSGVSVGSCAPSSCAPEAAKGRCG